MSLPKGSRIVTGNMGDEIVITTHKIDLRPSWWRHPVYRYRWHRMIRRHAKARAAMSPQDRQIADLIDKATEEIILFGERQTP